MSNHNMRKLAFVLSTGPGSITDLSGKSVLIHSMDTVPQEKIEKKSNLLLESLLPNNNNNEKSQLFWFKEKSESQSENLYVSIRSEIFPKNHICTKCRRVFDYSDYRIKRRDDPISLIDIIRGINQNIQENNKFNNKKLGRIDYVFCLFCSDEKIIKNAQVNFRDPNFQSSLIEFHKKVIKMQPFRHVGICDKGHIFDIDLFFHTHINNKSCDSRTDLTIDRSYKKLICKACNQEADIKEILYRGKFHKQRYQWLHKQDTQEECDSLNIQTALRGDKKVWYPINRTGLKLLDEKILNGKEEIKNQIDKLYSDVVRSNGNPNVLKKQIETNYLKEIDKFIALYYAKERSTSDKKLWIDISESDIRKVEYELLTEKNSTENDNSYEIINEVSLLNSELSNFIKKITRIDKLELDFTIIGLNRLGSELFDHGQKPPEAIPITVLDRYPMVKINIEGFFIKFDAEQFALWSKKNSEYIENLENSLFENLQRKKNIVISDDKSDLIEFYLLHSISHYLMSKLAFTSGYNVMSLRERLYFFPGVRGIMIHTTDGDEEGSMGGIAFNSSIPRMEKLFNELYPSLRQCSNDPTCLHDRPKGNNSNFAACYACLVLPETSCEFMNSYLDRNTLIGNGKDNKPSGFFSNYTHKEI
ncbi:MAG: hypothetical protein H7A24_16205 [Leptospiraceae bacterium]|nr:hypothetical protein [Leptospiraceae bacterium]